MFASAQRGDVVDFLKQWDLEQHGLSAACLNADKNNVTRTLLAAIRANWDRFFRGLQAAIRNDWSA